MFGPTLEAIWLPSLLLVRTVADFFKEAAVVS
jgi:hypothetical protein